MRKADGQAHPEGSVCCHHKGAASGSWREKPDGSRVKSKLVDLAGRNLLQKLAMERTWDLAKVLFNVLKDLSTFTCHRDEKGKVNNAVGDNKARSPRRDRVGCRAQMRGQLLTGRMPLPEQEGGERMGVDPSRCLYSFW